MAALDQLIDDRRVILCVGSGGVGKTTVAAALGLAAARRGKRVLCLTIDPARRLANSLGLDRMTADAQEISADLFAKAGLEVSGSLTVMMLDTKRTFDELVARHASSPEARDRILNNQLYHFVSTSLAGTQEYMAMEKLLHVQSEGGFDLIVLDTPPTSNALDFLDAPERMVQAIDSGAMKWLLQAFQSSGNFSFNLLARSVARILETISKLTGGGFLLQMAEFVSELNDLFGGFKQRADQVAAAFRSPEFAYVLVTSPAPMAIQEASFFAERLEAQGMARDAFVVNRVHRPPRVSAERGQVVEALERHQLELGSDGPDRLLRALEEEHRLAVQDSRTLELLEPALAPKNGGQRPIRVLIPALPSDVHDLSTLAGVSALLAPNT